MKIQIQWRQTKTQTKHAVLLIEKERQSGVLTCTTQKLHELQVTEKKNNNYTYSAGHSIRNNSNCLEASVQRIQKEKWLSNFITEKSRQ